MIKQLVKYSVLLDFKTSCVVFIHVFTDPDSLKRMRAVSKKNCVADWCADCALFVLPLRNTRVTLHIPPETPPLRFNMQHLYVLISARSCVCRWNGGEKGSRGMWNEDNARMFHSIRDREHEVCMLVWSIKTSVCFGLKWQIMSSPL